MATLTIRLPDDTHERLKQLAQTRHISVNKLFEEFSICALTEHDAQARFLTRAAQGNPERGLELLDKIDRHFS